MSTALRTSIGATPRRAIGAVGGGEPVKLNNTGDGEAKVLVVFSPPTSSRRSRRGQVPSSNASSAERAGPVGEDGIRPRG